MTQTREVVKLKTDSGYIFMLELKRFPGGLDMGYKRRGRGNKKDFKIVNQTIRRMHLLLTEMGKAMNLKRVEFQAFDLGHVGFEIPFGHQAEITKYPF